MTKISWYWWIKSIFSIFLFRDDIFICIKIKRLFSYQLSSYSWQHHWKTENIVMQNITLAFASWNIPEMVNTIYWPIKETLQKSSQKSLFICMNKRKLQEKFRHSNKLRQQWNLFTLFNGVWKFLEHNNNSIKIITLEQKAILL